MNTEILQLDLIAESLHNFGLDGIESYYPSYNEVCERSGKISEWIHKYSFLESGGSDFHSEIIPNKIGIGKFSTKIPYSLLRCIKEH
jgi:hypothetical protein